MSNIDTFLCLKTLSLSQPKNVRKRKMEIRDSFFIGRRLQVVGVDRERDTHFWFWFL